MATFSSLAVEGKHMLAREDIINHSTQSDSVKDDIGQVTRSTKTTQTYRKLIVNLWTNTM